MRRLLSVALLALTVALSPLPAQSRQVVVSPDTITLSVGQTARPVVTVLAGAGAVVSAPALTYSTSNSTVFSASRAGVITARALGCATWRVRHTTFAGAQVAVCVVPVAPPPPPPPVDTTPTPPPVDTTTPPTPGSLFFRSTWSTALGTSENAFEDGGKWELICCSGASNIFGVVAPSTVNWTGAGNVFRVLIRGTAGSQMEAPPLPVSTSHWVRMYVRNDDNANFNWHPSAYNTLGAIQLVPFSRAGSSTGWTTFAQHPGFQYPYVVWGPVAQLQNGQWYRFEWHMEYVSADRYRWWPRVYDATGALILEAKDYKRADYSGSGHDLASWYAAGNTFQLGLSGASSPSLARRFGIGNEGQNGMQAMGGAYYFADVAISLTNWVGR